MAQFVPLGIPDFNGNEEKGKIKFTIHIDHNDAEKLLIQVRDAIYEEEITDPDMLTVGTHPWYWDGFDQNGILDTEYLTQKAKLNLLSKVWCDGESEFGTTNFKANYEKVKWVDVRIDKNLKRINATIRVNLIDGGANGINCKDIPGSIKDGIPSRIVCPWENISKEALTNEGKTPLKKRTKSFEELKQLAIDGIDQYWSRRYNNTQGTMINDENWEVIVKAVNCSDSKISLDDIPLIFNTNKPWSRSGNTGGTYDDGNLDDEVMAMIPNRIVQRISYNVGYIYYSDWKDLDKSYKVYNQKGWEFYQKQNEDEDFKETSAHEIGHEILQAFGSTIYSWQHKGSSYYLPQDKKPLGKESFIQERVYVDFMEETKGEKYPASGEEVDLMKYYHNDKNIKSRIVASSKDILGLIWLTKIEFE